MPQKLEVSKPNQWFRMDGREEAGAERSEHGLGLGRPLGIRLCPASPGQVREGHLECSLSPSQASEWEPQMLCLCPGWTLHCVVRRGQQGV